MVSQALQGVQCLRQIDRPGESVNLHPSGNGLLWLLILKLDVADVEQGGSEAGLVADFLQYGERLLEEVKGCVVVAAVYSFMAW